MEDEETLAQETRHLNWALILAILALLLQMVLAGWLVWRLELQPQEPETPAFDQQAFEQWQRGIERQVSRKSRSGISREEFEALKTSLTRLEERDAGPSVAMVEMRQQLATLKATLSDLDKVQSEVEAAQTAQQMARSLAFQRLQQQVADGKSFVLELEALRRSLPQAEQNAPVVDRLGRFALQGVPREENVRARFEELRRAEDFTTDTADDSIWQGMKQNLTSLVKIRKVGPEHQGDDDASILARVETHVQAGKWRKALEALQQASGNAQQYYAPFELIAQERLQALEAVEELQQLPLAEELLQEHS